MILLEELRHVDDQVANHGKSRQRPQHDRLRQRLQIGDARETVLAVDVHRIGAAYAFAAAPAKRQRIVDRLQADQRIEQHPIVRIERDVVVTVIRLRVFLRIVAVDAKFHFFVFTKRPSRWTSGKAPRNERPERTQTYVRIASEQQRSMASICEVSLNTCVFWAEMLRRTTVSCSPACTRADCRRDTTACASAS